MGSDSFFLLTYTQLIRLCFILSVLLATIDLKKTRCYPKLVAEQIDKFRNEIWTATSFFDWKGVKYAKAPLFYRKKKYTILSSATKCLNLELLDSDRKTTKLVQLPLIGIVRHPTPYLSVGLGASFFSLVDASLQAFRRKGIAANINSLGVNFVIISCGKLVIAVGTAAKFIH